MNNYCLTKCFTFSLFLFLVSFETFSFNLVISSEIKQKHLKVAEYSEYGEMDVSVGSNDISLKNYPNAVHFFRQKNSSNYQFISMVWVESDTSTVHVNLNENGELTYSYESLEQIELAHIVDSSPNIHLGPFPYKAELNQPLKPILAIEAGFILKNFQIVTEQSILVNLLKLSKVRGIENWSTEVISKLLNTEVYNNETNKLVKLIGLDSLGKTVQITPKDKYILLAMSFTGCAPCLKGLPKMRKEYDQIKEKILFVTAWEEPTFKSFKDRQLDKRNIISWPSIWDQYGIIANELQTQIIPTYILFDPSGREINRWEGKFPKDLDSAISN